jgi:hypothetical protein
MKGVPTPLSHVHLSGGQNPRLQLSVHHAAMIASPTRLVQERTPEGALAAGLISLKDVAVVEADVTRAARAEPFPPYLHLHLSPGQPPILQLEAHQAARLRSNPLRLVHRLAEPSPINWEACA